MSSAIPVHSETATLGGGCFWCLEAVFEQLQGVQSVESGYSGGTMPNPSYRKSVRALPAMWKWCG